MYKVTAMYIDGLGGCRIEEYTEVRCISLDHAEQMARCWEVPYASSITVETVS